MYIDKLLEFSDGQALTASGRSTDIVDLGSARQIGVGKPLWIVFQVDVAADGTTTDETYEFKIETDSVEAMSSPTELASRTIGYATLVAGYQFTMAVPMENVEQFISPYFTLGGTTPSITISAWLTDQHPQVWEALPDAL